jgi:hypothetical protein
MKIACVSHRLQFQKRRQLFIGVHNETLPSSRCASATQIVRPLESIAENGSPNSNRLYSGLLKSAMEETPQGAAKV